jgi:hypothetical protein
MFRALLACYMTLVAALGPALCCCTFARDVGPADSTEATKAPKLDCCGHPVTEEGGCTGSDQSPSKPACPCGKHKQPAAPAAAKTPADLASADASGIFFPLLVHAVIQAASFALDVSSLSCIAHLHLSQFSAQGLLRAPYVLRC